ncbi:MAG TPA: hypothetical protein VGB50_01710 [Flavobacterium sp.]|jgi:hypothetical protein
MKSLLSLLMAFVALSAVSQDKNFTFDEIQSRNASLEWESSQKVKQRTAHFTADEIVVDVDKSYRLDIVKETHLPDNGVIYLCKDEKRHDVTVMLISDDKMYLYDEEKRFLINFTNPTVIKTGRSYADLD